MIYPISNIKIKVSGANKKLLGGICDNKIWIEMPIIKGDISKSIKQIDESTYFIKLKGIVFLVINDMPFKGSIKEYAFSILKKYKLLKYKACGIIFYSYDKVYMIKPIIYVKKVNTLYEEKACGSGSIALGIALSYILNKNINEDILQPSQDFININIFRKRNKIIGATIKGMVDTYE